jgi:antitoxin component of MazEF toxin-antitoxin module
MNYYKDYAVSKRDVDVQLSIAIPKAVVKHMRLKKGDVLRLVVGKGERIFIEPVRRRGRK